MDILKGLLFINGLDVYETYGAFLSEENEGDHANYSALLKVGKAKSRTAVDFPEEHGRRYGDAPETRLDERSVTLRFTIEGRDPAEFLSRYSRFVSMLCAGWIVMRLPELCREFRFLYSDCEDWDQITPIDGMVYASFRVTLTEPCPDHGGLLNTD